MTACSSRLLRRCAPRNDNLLLLTSAVTAIIVARMDRSRLRELLAQVGQGVLTIDDAMDRLRAMPFEDLGFAKVDHHRALRMGLPEVIFGEGKSAGQIISIAQRISDS